MKKILLFLSLISVVNFSQNNLVFKNKIKDVKKDNNFVIISNDNIENKFDKFIVPFSTNEKDYKILVSDEENLLKFFLNNANKYDNLGFLYKPKENKFVCLNNDNENITVVSIFKNSLVELNKKNNISCTKKMIEQMLILPGKLETKNITNLKFDFGEKEYIDLKNLKEIVN